MLIQKRSFPAAAATLTFLVSAGASAQPHCDLPVSAYLSDGDGVPLDGTTDVELRFYGEPAPDAPPTECRSFTDAIVDAGWLRVTVDGCSTPPAGDCGLVPLADLFAGADGLWVGVSIDGTELGPRLPIGAVPFAVRAGNADTLQGLAPTAFEATGSIDAHAANADAHHSSTSDGIAITPSSVTVGDTHVESGRVDLGADATDELTAEIVATLTGGGEADALHGHAADGGAGGNCYVAWGATSCGGAFEAMYTGVIAQLTQYSDWGGTGIGVSAVGPMCVADEAIGSFASIAAPLQYSEIMVGRDGRERIIPVGDRLGCAVCCQ